MATVGIQKRKRQNRNSYIVTYKDSAGQRKYYKTFRKQRDAQQSANELRALLDAGKITELNKSKAKTNLLRFEEVSDLLMAKWKKKLNDGELRKNTIEEYCYRLKKIGRVFDKRLICEISFDDIENYRYTITQEFSNITSNRDLFIIKQVFLYGLELNAIKDNPAERINYLSEKAHERNKFLMPAEINRLIEASQEVRSKHSLPAMIYLAVEHGCSKQEILSLKWADINFDFEGIGIIRFFRTKNSKERTDYLMPRTKEALLQWQKHQQWMRHRKKIDDVNSDLVFCRLNGSPIKRFDKSWRETRKIAGFHDLHFHDLRHTFCSNLLLSGADLKDVKEMIGHKDLSMTDRYSHLTISRNLAKQQELAKLYANGNGDKKNLVGNT